MTWCRERCTVVALADEHRLIKRPKAKKERITFAPMNMRFSFNGRTAPRLHSSDDGLILTTSTLRRLEQEVQHLAIPAHCDEDAVVGPDRSALRKG
jgi:hypothetical protein